MGSIEPGRAPGGASLVGGSFAQKQPVASEKKAAQGKAPAVSGQKAAPPKVAPKPAPEPTQFETSMAAADEMESSVDDLFADLG